MSFSSSSSAPRERRGPSKRPFSIAELAEKANDNTVWVEGKDFKSYLRLAEKYRKDGKELAKRGDIEGAFIELAKAVSLVQEKLPKHRDFSEVLNDNQRANLTQNGLEILDNLNSLKPTLVERYDKWLQTHSDGVDQERTPNVRTHKMDDDGRMQTQAHAQAQQRAKLQEEEFQRQRERVTLEQKRLTAEEAAMWRQQRELIQARDREESERERDRKKDVAVAAARRAIPQANAPDYTFARPPNQNTGYGSQNTIVVSDGRPEARHQQQQQQRQQQRQQSLLSLPLPPPPQQQPIQQEHIRLRDEEIARRESIKKRQQEQEGITRRQHEAEEAARAARQIIAAPQALSAPSASIPTAQALVRNTSIASIPISGYQHPPYSAVPYSAIEFPRALPLESPATSSSYEGDSTDSESTTKLHDHRKMNKAPLKPLRRSSPSFPPPVTTTSPLPNSGLYPLVMSHHQKTQGYFPSLHSMFVESAGRHFGMNSVLFGNGDVQGPQPWNPQQMRPAPALPTTYPPSTLPQRNSEAMRLPIPQDAIFDPNIPLKQVGLPRDCLPRFLTIAKANTELNKETCGLLLGKQKGMRYMVTTLLIPKQRSTSDTCTMDGEELVMQFTEKRNLITLGWIHTHPSQSCFMSSVDLHTHSGFQRMLPESFAVVCAPKSNPNYGIFRLTDPPGLKLILNCREKEAFHPHPDQPIYTDADKGHVQMKDGPIEIVDLR